MPFVSLVELKLRNTLSEIEKRLSKLFVEVYQNCKEEGFVSQLIRFYFFEFASQSFSVFQTGLAIFICEVL